MTSSHMEQIECALRWCVLALCILNAVRATPGAFTALTGNLNASAGGNLTMVMLCLGIGGFQSTFLFEGGDIVATWRVIANLVTLLVGLAMSMAVWVARVGELDMQGKPACSYLHRWIRGDLA